MICKAIRNFLRAKFPVKKLLRFALYLFSYRIELLAVGRQRLINMYWKRGFEMKEKGSSFSGSIGFVLAEISVPLCEGWGRSVSLDLSCARIDLWLCVADN